MAKVRQKYFLADSPTLFLIDQSTEISNKKFQTSYLNFKHNIHAVGRDRKTKIVKKRKRKLEVAKSSEDFTASDTETNENSEKPEEMPKKEEFCLPDTLVELLREDEKRILSENQTSIKEHQLNVKYVFDLFEYELYLNPSKESSSALVSLCPYQTLIIPPKIYK